MNLVWLLKGMDDEGDLAPVFFCVFSGLLLEKISFSPFQANLTDVQGVFFFFGVFLGFSTLVFFCEVTWKYTRKVITILCELLQEAELKLLTAGMTRNKLTSQEVAPIEL